MTKEQGTRFKAQGFRLLPSAFSLWNLGLGIFFLALYTLTLAPSLLPADAGEYQVVGAVLGVAHPPGFALYTLLGWLTSRLLFSAAAVVPATAINFLSALMASLTLVLVSRTVTRLTQLPWAGVCAALALGFSTTFWAQATTANVRILTAFAVALALERITVYRSLLATERAETAEKNSPRTLRAPRLSLALVALALGLGVSHHGSLVFVAAVLGLYTLWLNPSVVRRPWPLLAGLLPFLFWLYFPLRAGAFNAPPRLATLDGFLEHILARGFRGDMLFFATPEYLPDRFLVFGNILTFEFVWPLLLLTAFGGLAALWRDRGFGVLLLAAFAVHSFIAITYKSPQTVEYLLPSYVFMAVLTGFAFADFFRAVDFLTAGIAKRAEKLKAAPHPVSSSPLHLLTYTLTRLLTASLLLTPQFLSTFPSYRVLARDTATREYVEALLAAAPPDAVLLASWHWVTPLWYLQQVEGQRPDVEVKYVFPHSASLAQDWADEIAADLAARPVVVTSFYPQEYGALPYRFLPLGSAWEVRAGPLLTPPANLTGSQTFGDWEFLGYHLQSPVSSAQSVPSVDLTAAWRTSAAPRDINFFVQLIGPDGLLYAQMDVNRPASRYVSGEVLLDRYHLTLRPDSLPGDYALIAGAYLPDGTRLAEEHLTTISIAARSTPPVTLHPLYRNISGATLIGYDIDYTLPDSPRLYLHWRLGRQPVTLPALDSSISLPPGPGYLTTAHDLAPDQPITVSNFKLPSSDLQSRYIPLDNSIILTGADLSPAGRLRPGQTLTVDLHFLAARPITQDIAVKVELSSAGRRAVSEGTPVGGAIPTLKWITGSRLTDRRTLIVPADAAPGPARLGLVLYDAFTQRKLALLDPRLARLGPTVPLGTLEIVQP